MAITKRARFALIIAIVAILTVTIGVLFYLFGAKADKLFVSGRIEGYEVDISPKYSGKICYIAGREGKKVNESELLIKIESPELQTQLEAATANIESVIQQQKQAVLQLNIIKSQLKQTELALNQTSEKSMASIEQAQESLGVAKQQYEQAHELLNQANYEFNLAKSDVKRYTNLVKTGSIAQQVFEQAQTRLNTAKSAQSSRKIGVNVSSAQIEQAQALLAQAKASKYNPENRKEQINLLKAQLEQAKSQLEAAKSNVNQTQAQKRQILAQMSYFDIKSPINGVIITRTSEPGEIVSAGKTILTLLNYNNVYLRGYIPEGKIGHIYVGQPAYVYLDSQPKEPLKGTVSAIDAEASFTPENIYFKEDRVKQVFGIKIKIDNPKGLAKPGMPADGEILLANK